jgi:hypothetical protein
MYTWEQLRLDFIFNEVLTSPGFEFDYRKGFFFYNLSPQTVNYFRSFLCYQLQCGRSVRVEERQDTTVYGDPREVLTLAVRYQELTTDNIFCLDITFPRSENGDWIQVHGFGFPGANEAAFRTGNRQHTFTDPVSLDFFQHKLQELKDNVCAENARVQNVGMNAQLIGSRHKKLSFLRSDGSNYSSDPPP